MNTVVGEGVEAMSVREPQRDRISHILILSVEVKLTEINATHLAALSNLL